jgi:hypothetical protein
MTMVDVNYVAVLVAAIVNMAVGFVWYSKGVFGATWMKLIGKTEKQIKEGANTNLYIAAFVASLVTSFVLAQFVALSGAVTAMDGFLVGLWAGIGFVATTFAADAIFNGKPMQLYGINVGYNLVSLVLMGALLAVWA